jgi:hypothetical protein
MNFIIMADVMGCIAQVKSHINVPLRNEPVVEFYAVDAELPEEINILPKHWVLNCISYNPMLHLT